MLLPNKLYSYNESILSKLPVVLRLLKRRPMSVHELYQEGGRSFDSVSEYIDALDCLYALHKIEYDDLEGVLRYVV